MGVPGGPLNGLTAMRSPTPVSLATAEYTGRSSSAANVSKTLTLSDISAPPDHQSLTAELNYVESIIPLIL
jgi:hypothetical protein